MLDRLQKWLPPVVLHTLVLGVPLLFTPAADELFEFPKMIVVYFAALVLVFAWLLTALRTQKLLLPRTIFEIPILVFLISQTVSTLLSLDPHTSFFGYYSRFNGGLLSLYSYVIIFYAAIIWIKPSHHKSLLTSVAIGGVLSALYAFPEHFGHSPSCLLITGKFTADCWIQDVQSRVFGTVGQPNWLAAYMVVLLPFAIARLQTTDHRSQIFKKIGWASAFLLFSLVLLYTKSRSGILGAGIAVGMFTLSTIVLEWKKRNSNKSVLSSLSPVVFLAIFCILVLSIANPVRDKLAQIIHIPAIEQSSTASRQSPTTGTQLDSGGSESGDIRKVVWTGAIRVWLRYPVFGSGVETFAYSYFKDRPTEHNLLSEWDFLYNKAHNEFLNFLATTGAVGLISYVIMYGSFIVFPLLWAFNEAKNTHTDSRGAHYVLLATSSSLTGLAVSNFFGFSTVVVSMLTFLLPALTAQFGGARLRSLDLSSLLRKKSVSRILLGALMLATTSLLISTYRIYSIDVDYATAKSLIDHDEVETGVALLQSVVDRAPYEPVYRDELAYTAARLSYALGITGDSTSSAQLAQAAIDHSDEVIAQNPVNVNFFKTRARIFTLLGQLTPVFYGQATATLLQARALSPTDPKLTYNLAIIAKATQDLVSYEKFLLETLSLRPIDLQARIDLAQYFESVEKSDRALDEFAKVLQLDPNNQIAKARIASLSAIKKK